MTSLLTLTQEILGEAESVYADDPVAGRIIAELRLRLHEPVRVAVAGMVKTGKSTLLNAMIGEQIAPTDAGECTRTVIWYRYAHTATITAHLHDGGTRRLRVIRSEGRIQFDLGGLTADRIERIEVGWPSETLRSYVLIDTPGIGSLTSSASAVTTQFLTPRDVPTQADAVVYLFRQVHAVDLSFLEALADPSTTAVQATATIAVLSRADEVGSGRIDSLLSAARVGQRHLDDGTLRGMTLGVVPLAGLLAEGARTLREDEFEAFRDLAGLDRARRERLLLSADRFLQPETPPVPAVARRRALLDRFGVFGVRLAITLVNAGARTSGELAQSLVLQSGVEELEVAIARHFRDRSGALKARAVLAGLDALARTRARAGSAHLLTSLERAAVNNHELRELQLLARLRTGAVSLSNEDRREADRILGGSGTSRYRRLDLPETASPREVQERIDDLAARWRALAASPLLERDSRECSAAVARSVEQQAVDVVPSRL